MKTYVVVLALAAVLMGCAPDDQVFDTSTLAPHHQTVFRRAMADLNREKPNAVFEASDDGHSVVTYGTPNPGANCTTFRPVLLVAAWRIVCRPEVRTWPDADLYRTMLHELCHVLGVKHEDGNPWNGDCLTSEIG